MSGQINEYQVISVDENRQVIFKHKLPYVEVFIIHPILQCYLICLQRTDKLKVENKSLMKRLEDMEKVLTENSKTIMNWQVAAQTVEGLKSSPANTVC